MEIDDSLADLVDEDPDHAMSLLAQMRGATDQKLAALAARLAGRLVLDVARRPGSGPWRAQWRRPADRVDGDLDLDASLDGLVHAGHR